jgi:hypothetical protein
VRLDKALREAFDKSNPKQFPRFKKRGINDSFRYPQGFKLDDKTAEYSCQKSAGLATEKAKISQALQKTSRSNASLTNGT